MVLIHVILWWHIENQCLDWLPVTTTAHWNHLRRSKKCQSLSFVPYQWNRILECEAWVVWLLKLSRWFRRIAMIENWEYKSRVYFSFGLKDTKDNGEKCGGEGEKESKYFWLPLLGSCFVIRGQVIFSKNRGWLQFPNFLFWDLQK